MSDICKVTVGLRNQGSLHTETAICLAEMYGYTALKYCAGGHLEIGIFAAGGSILPDISESVAEAAINNGSDYILWIDSDMTFPPYTLEELLLSAQKAEVPLVGCNYPQRRRPAKPTAKHDGGWMYMEDVTPDEYGLVEADFMGMGVLLTHTDIFRQLPRPWFPFTYDEENHKWGGEDVYMMRALKEHLGYSPRVHAELSKKIGHVGKTIFTHQHSTEDRHREHEACFDGVMPHQKRPEAAE